jgi:hypothetical protein
MRRFRQITKTIGWKAKTKKALKVLNADQFKGGTDNE